MVFKVAISFKSFTAQTTFIWFDGLLCFLWCEFFGCLNCNHFDFKWGIFCLDGMSLFSFTMTPLISMIESFICLFILSKNPGSLKLQFWLGLTLFHVREPYFFVSTSTIVSCWASICMTPLSRSTTLGSTLSPFEHLLLICNMCLYQCQPFL